MPETNGHQDNPSRLDRIEAALELVIGEHETFRAEHKMLLRSQVLFQDSLEKMKERAVETEGKLNALIDFFDQNSREFHGRLKGLENRQ